MMKNHFFPFAAALAVVISSGFTACGKHGNNDNSDEVHNPDRIELVYVEGTGTGPGAIRGFYIGKYEVTQAQWKAIMDGDNPSNWYGDNLPVEMVNWSDAQEFIARLSAAKGIQYSLPTVAEWEYAATGGSKSRNYEYSGGNDLDSVAWWHGNSDDRTHPVGTKQPNELGLYDMSGNVWEWCYVGDGISESDYVLRGGCWFSIADYCHPTYPGGGGNRNPCAGFRVVVR